MTHLWISRCRHLHSHCVCACMIMCVCCVCSVCFRVPTCHLFLLSRQSDHSEFIVRNQNSSLWISTGAGAADFAQQVEGTLPPVLEGGLLGHFGNESKRCNWTRTLRKGEHRCCKWSSVHDSGSKMAGMNVTLRGNSNKADFSGKSSSKITSKYI